MDIKKKILLGEKDIIAKSNEDMFININLNSTFSEIRKDKFENTFDVSQQFNKERNASRDFRIYGTIDSITDDMNSVNIFVFSALTAITDLLAIIPASGLVYSEVNAFGKKRGKYLIELNKYPADIVYLGIAGNFTTYLDQIYTQQLVFKDADGNFIDYGTQTIEIDNNGNSVDVNNDFYFLYNKHWIKKDLLITRIP